MLKRENEIKFHNDNNNIEIDTVINNYVRNILQYEDILSPTHLKWAAEVMAESEDS